MPNSSERRRHLLSLRLTEADLDIIDRAAKRRGFLRAHFVRDAVLRAAEDTLMETVPLRLKPAAFRVFLEVLSKPAGAVPQLSELLRREAPGESEAGK